MSSNSPIIYSEASNLLIPVYFFTSETIIFIYPILIYIFHIFFMSLFNMLILYFLNIWSIFIIAVLMSLCINFSICFYRLTCLLIMGISSCFFACMPFLIECQTLNFTELNARCIYYNIFHSYIFSFFSFCFMGTLVNEIQ